MRLPSPSEKRAPLQSAALLEIVGLVVALVGLVWQSWQQLAGRGGPSEIQRLAAALVSRQPSQGLTVLAQFTPPHPIVVWGGPLLTAVGLMTVFRFRYERAIAQDDRENQARSPDGLRGCALVIQGLLAARLGGSESVRVTFYKVVDLDGGAELEQVIDYAGEEPPRGKGRLLPVSKGIVGLCARTGEPQVAVRASSTDDEYIEELVNRWGFTRTEAQEMRLDRKSFVSVPIFVNAPGKGGPRQPLGVVHVDSTSGQLGDDEDLLDLIVVGARATSAYIIERFS